MADCYSNGLVCPITYTLFREPVVAEDGHTYERQAIIQWIKCDNTSPLTREPITIEGLRPNHIVRNLVEEFRNKLSKRQYKFKLGVDIERSQNPFFQTAGKSIFHANWIGNPNGPPIVLLKLFGARAEKEASFYEQLTRHPHVVYTYGLVEPPNETCNTCLMLLQEMAPLGSLINVLEHHSEQHPNKHLSDRLLNHIFIQICSAMTFLSSKGIIHGDLACRNILVFKFDEQEPHRTLVKLTDFGISRGSAIYSKVEAVETIIDTIPIRSSAPEVLQHNDNDDGNASACVYSEKTDMFSMGVLMREAYANGQVPWIEINKEKVIRKKVIDGERLSRPHNCKSDSQWNLILKCMSQCPKDRPTFAELEQELKRYTNLCNNSTTTTTTELIQVESSSLTSSVINELTERTDEIRSPLSQEIKKVPASNDTQSTLSDKPILSNGYVRSILKQFESNVKSPTPSLKNEKKPSNSSLRSLPIVQPPPPAPAEPKPPREELIKLTKWH